MERPTAGTRRERATTHRISERDAAWDERCRQLVAFHRTHGHFVVPPRVQTYPLYLWIRFQRLRVRQGRLAPERRKRLMAIGFPFDFGAREALAVARQSEWDRCFAALEAFRRKSGHLTLPVGTARQRALAAWATTQRRRERLGLLATARKARLARIGFDFHPSRTASLAVRFDSQWERMFDRLARFKAVNGRCAGPWKGEERLARWVTNQRCHWRRGELRPDRERRLRRLGFPFEDALAALRGTRDRLWNDRLRAVLAFRRTHGHTAIPSRGPTRTLAHWVETQRRRAREGSLPAPRAQRLTVAGLIVGDARRERPSTLTQPKWDARFLELLAFQRRFGHLRVGATARGTPLGTWCDRQRREFRAGRLTRGREQRLRQIGFDFEPSRATPRWTAADAHLQGLREFRRKHGHLSIPVAPPHRALHAWLHARRAEAAGGNLAADIRTALEKLGVPLAREDIEWEAWFAQAAEFRKRRGNLEVDPATALGRFLSRERRRMHDGNLPLDRETRLVAIGVK